MNIINEYYEITLFSDGCNDIITVRCYLYSYEKVAGDPLWLSCSDVDYYGTSEIEWDVVSIKSEEGVSYDTSNLSDEDFEYIEKELIDYAEQYLEEIEASQY